VLVGRAVLDGCGVDFSGNGGHFFGLGTARQRLARAAYFTAIGAARRRDARLLNGPERNITRSQARLRRPRDRRTAQQNWWELRKPSTLLKHRAARRV